MIQYTPIRHSRCCCPNAQMPRAPLPSPRLDGGASTAIAIASTLRRFAATSPAWPMAEAGPLDADG